MNIKLNMIFVVLFFYLVNCEVESRLINDIASPSSDLFARRVLSETDLDEVFEVCDCDIAVQIGTRFCEKGRETGQWKAACDDAQTVLNTFYMAESLSQCHLNICEESETFMGDLCDIMENTEDPDAHHTACSIVANMEAGRRRLNRRRLPCFDEDVRVTMKDGSERRLRNLKAGESIETCEPGRFTRVISVLNHKDLTKRDFLTIEVEGGNSLKITAEHLVFSEGKFVRADSMLPGMTMDGRTVTNVYSSKGRRMDFTTFWHDIKVNGMCGTWYIDDFRWMERYSPFFKAMNPLVDTWPDFVFPIIQAVVDEGILALDDGRISFEYGGLLCFCTGIALLVIYFAVVIGLTTFAFQLLTGKTFFQTMQKN